MFKAGDFNNDNYYYRIKLLFPLIEQSSKTGPSADIRLLDGEALDCSSALLFLQLCDGGEPFRL